MSPTDHDRIVTVEHDTNELSKDMDDVKPRLRRVEDSLLQAKTTLTIVKAVFGLVSVSVIVQLAMLLQSRF
jgi:hypothetical protein